MNVHKVKSLARIQNSELWLEHLKCTLFPFIFTEFYICAVCSIQSVYINWISARKLYFLNNKYDTGKSSCLSGMTQFMGNRNSLSMLEDWNNENGTFYASQKFKNSNWVASGVDNQWKTNVKLFVFCVHLLLSCKYFPNIPFWFLSLTYLFVMLLVLVIKARAKCLKAKCYKTDL